ncbi:hypothetical protein AGLY_011311 [Aphis glycines]|uniref:Uncharacterized protein n=1 Tax=Aphis glycines TaxID=307491 RepID=A0A6G0TD95_APHGL|nr:hypothetical protein AGLY_011311 [Aphis glycines]
MPVDLENRVEQKYDMKMLAQVWSNMFFRSTHPVSAMESMVSVKSVSSVFKHLSSRVYMFDVVLGKLFLSPLNNWLNRRNEGRLSKWSPFIINTSRILFNPLTTTHGTDPKSMRKTDPKSAMISSNTRYGTLYRAIRYKWPIIGHALGAGGSMRPALWSTCFVFNSSRIRNNNTAVNTKSNKICLVKINLLFFLIVGNRTAQASNVCVCVVGVAVRCVCGALALDNWCVTFRFSFYTYLIATLPGSAD